MATYENCLEIIEDIRFGLDDHSDDKVKGIDTSGSFKNKQILKAINRAQYFLYDWIKQRDKSLFLKYTTIVGSSSVYTLPWDFVSVVAFKDENGRPVYPVNPEDSFKNTSSSGSGSDSYYYRSGNTFVLEKDSVSATYRLWYIKKPRDLTYGKTSAGAATSMTLSTDAKLIADYYNDMTVENTTQDWVDTIDDYTAARVATISETAAANDYYGLVSELPSGFHKLIAPKALIELKKLPQTKVNLTRDDKDDFNGMLIEATNAFIPQPNDVDMADLWTDYDTGAGSADGMLLLED